MAHEQLVVTLSRGFLCALRGEPVGGALELATVREDFEREGDAIATRRDLEGAHIERQFGDRLGLPAGETQEPHLRGAAATRKEVHAGTVRRPARRGVCGRVLRQAARHRRGCGGVHEPQVRAAAVGGHVRFAQRENDVAPVRRYPWIAQAGQLHEILCGEGTRRCGALRGGCGRHRPAHRPEIRHGGERQDGGERQAGATGNDGHGCAPRSV